MALPLTSEALSDHAKFCCVVAALLALQLAIKILREVQAAVLPALCSRKTRVSSLKTRDENRILREGGNLLLSGTVHCTGTYCVMLVVTVQDLIVQYNVPLFSS